MVKIIVTIFLGLVIVALAAKMLEPQVGLARREIKLGSVSLTVDVADTPLSRARGLSGHAPLNDSEGMLFIFDKADYHRFWMRGMKFSIDIIWLDENLQVVDISTNLAPDSYPSAFTPIKPAKYVIEVRAGWAVDHGVNIGTPVVI